MNLCRSIEASIRKGRYWSRTAHQVCEATPVASSNRLSVGRSVLDIPKNISTAPACSDRLSRLSDDQVITLTAISTLASGRIWIDSKGLDASTPKSKAQTLSAGGVGGSSSRERQVKRRNREAPDLRRNLLVCSEARDCELGSQSHNMLHL